MYSEFFFEPCIFCPSSIFPLIFDLPEIHPHPALPKISLPSSFSPPLEIFEDHGHLLFGHGIRLRIVYAGGIL